MGTRPQGPPNAPPGHVGRRFGESAREGEYASLSTVKKKKKREKKGACWVEHTAAHREGAVGSVQLQASVLPAVGQGRDQAPLASTLHAPLGRHQPALPRLGMATSGVFGSLHDRHTHTRKRKCHVFRGSKDKYARSSARARQQGLVVTTGGGVFVVCAGPVLMLMFHLTMVRGKGRLAKAWLSPLPPLNGHSAFR